jgi:hypothetical protein
LSKSPGYGIEEKEEKKGNEKKNKFIYRITTKLGT